MFTFVCACLVCACASPSWKSDQYVVNRCIVLVGRASGYIFFQAATMVEVIQDQKEWLTIAIFLLKCCIFASFCLLLKRLVDTVRNHAFFKPCTLPGMQTNHLVFYFSVLLTLYKQSRPNCPPLTLLQQGLSGICRTLKDEKLFRIYLLFKPTVFFYKPETVEVILSSSTLIDKSKEYNLLAPWLGTGLLTSTGPKWRFRRKLLTPTFHFSILEEFIQVFHEQSSVLVSKLKQRDHEPWVDIVPFMTSCTLDIICQTAMGVCINAQGDDNDDYVTAIHEIGDAFMYRVLRPWLYPDVIFNCTAFGRRFRTNLQKVQGFTRKVIKDKKAAMISSGKLSPVLVKAPEGSPMQRKRRKAFLELLLEHHLKDPTFTEEDIREEVDTFMFEGHDTTAMALSWTLYLLGLHPEIQKIAHDEVDDIFQNDLEREVSRQDLSNMKYLECIIKEALRLYPSVPMIGRECNESFQVDGHTVHRGSFCVILPMELHHDPDSFPEPEKFNPERFFAENSAGRHPYAYIPFSAGPRNCIGQRFALMEEKTVLANILRQFRITSLDPRDRVLVQPNLTTRNVMPLRLRFKKR